MVKLFQTNPRLVRPLMLRRAGVQGALVLSDPVRLPRPLGFIPRGAGLVLRHYATSDRPAKARQWVRAQRRKSGALMISGDARLAASIGAGLHVKDGAPRPRILLRGPLTMAAHTRRALWRAKAARTGAALVSPVFPTQSHPGARTLGPHRFARLIRGAGVPVFALGGLNRRTAARLKAIPGLQGIAAIDGWYEERQQVLPRAAV